MNDNQIEKASSVFRQMRAYRGITKLELYNRSKIARSTLTSFEQGKANPRLETLLTLADALDCHLEISLKPKDNKQEL